MELAFLTDTENRILSRKGWVGSTWGRLDLPREHTLEPMPNSLLTKEFRVQMRGRETHAVSTVYVLVLSALTIGLIWQASTGQPALGPEYGRGMFLAFAIALILAVSMICPAFAVGAVSSERERLTFDQLRVTLLRPHQVLIGKVGPVLVYSVILLVAALPMIILIAPAGGISTTEVALCYLIAFVSAMAFSLVGLMWSSICTSTRAATTMTYATIGLLIFGTAMVPVTLSRVFGLKANRVLQDLGMALNPFHAVASILGRGRQFQVAGLMPWETVVISYTIVSITAAYIFLLRFRRMGG